MESRNVARESKTRGASLRLRVRLWAVAILVLTLGIVTAALFVKERAGGGPESGQRDSRSCVRGSTDAAHRRCVR